MAEVASPLVADVIVAVASASVADVIVAVVAVASASSLLRVAVVVSLVFLPVFLAKRVPPLATALQSRFVVAVAAVSL